MISYLLWHKQVKRECPLCKRPFQSVIHNVKAIDQFEQYNMPPPILPDNSYGNERISPRIMVLRNRNVIININLLDLLAQNLIGLPAALKAQAQPKFKHQRLDAAMNVDLPCKSPQ